MPREYPAKYLRVDGGPRLIRSSRPFPRKTVSYPNVLGLIAMFPATETATIKKAKKIINSEARLSLLSRPRLYFNERRDKGNNAITVNQTKPNLT